MSTKHVSREDLTLYSMQALSPAENAEVQAHLDSCATCRGVLADVFTDVSLIGLSVEQQQLPEGARQRFIEKVATTPQVLRGTVSTAAPASTPVPAPVTAPPSRTSGFGWFGWVIAAAALAAAFYLGYQRVELKRQLNDSRGQVAQLSAQATRLQDLMEALTSPEAKQVTLTETRQPVPPVGHAIYLPKTGALIFVASRMHPLAQNKTYELWLIPASGKAPVPAGLFRPDTTGSASVVLPPLPAGIEAKAFGVTVEDAQGATTPTLPIVMAGQ